MKNYIKRSISFIASSDPKNGATNINSLKNRFELELQRGIAIPANAENCELSVEEATVWWSVPNLITGKNDKFYITGPNTSDVVTNFVLTIPQGLYDLSGLNQAIQRELENAGAKITPTTLISISGDEATQKVEIRFNYNNVSIDFTQANTFREILGFNSAVLGPFGTVPNNQLAPNVANFNTVNSFLLHSDLVDDGILYGNKYNQSIANILIDVSPGSQIVYKPFNPAKSDINNLKGNIRKTIKFWLTDEENNDISTNDEYYSCRLLLTYLEPIEIKENLKTRQRQ